MSITILLGHNHLPAIKPETYVSLREHVPASVSIDLIDVSRSPTAYWHAIRDRWTGEDDLVIIEQDIEITAETIPSFQSCAAEWCVFGYKGADWLEPEDRFMVKSLGCTKFSARLQRTIPASTIAGVYLVWHMIDMRMATVLGMRGYTPHLHGEVKHLHDYDGEHTPEQQQAIRQQYLQSKLQIDAL
jgi:hypothetical protein